MSDFSNKKIKIKKKINGLDEKTYIGKKGYGLKKDLFSKNEIDSIKEELKVTPYVGGDYGVVEKPFKVYRENNTHLYLPKFFGIEKFGNPKSNVIHGGTTIDIQFSLELRNEQKIPAQKTMDAYHEKGGGILSLGCGAGKTILGLYFVSQIKKRTLVIVHKEFLMNQWIERIQFALPDAKIGIVQGNKCEIEGKDIIIGMLQTLSMRDFEKDTFNSIGHVIIDECHRIPSRVFMKALFKIQCKYMLGLSATPNRKDGCTKVLKWFIGDIVFSLKSEQRNIVKVKRYLVDSQDENYNREILNFKGQVQISSMMNQVSLYMKRTKLIVKLINEELKEHEDRQILILSDRKQQLEDFNKLLKSDGIDSVGYYVGGMKQKDLKKSESCKVLLGTFPMANEGLDIPSLNSLILATPKSDIIQSIGRICRVKHENIQPLIIDIVDQFSVFERQAKKRFEVFRKNKSEIQDIKFDLDKNEIYMRKNYDYHHIDFEEKKKPKKKETLDLNQFQFSNNNENKQKKDDFEDLFNTLDVFSNKK